MGRILQASNVTLDEDFDGHEGCNEVLNVTRPAGTTTRPRDASLSRDPVAWRLCQVS